MIFEIFKNPLPTAPVWYAKPRWHWLHRLLRRKPTVTVLDQRVADKIRTHKNNLDFAGNVLSQLGARFGKSKEHESTTYAEWRTAEQKARRKMAAMLKIAELKQKVS